VQVKECWEYLCEQAAVEHNSAKLIALVKEINRLLDEKLTRLGCKAPEPETSLVIESSGQNRRTGPS
jgi:hypothetical protein